MLQISRWRIILVLMVTAFGLAFSMPNFVPENLRDKIPVFLPHQAISLGLDLRGGSHLLLEVDTATLRKQHLESTADQMGQAFRDAEPRIISTGRGVVGDAARIRVTNPADLPRARAALRSLARTPNRADDILVFSEGPDGLIEARLTPSYVRDLSRGAARESVEVIRRRIDPNGTSEVSITPQGDDRIVVQAPGVSDPEQLRSRIGQTALMTFHLVPTGERAGGVMTVPPYPGMEERSGPVTVERRVQFTGERLQRANPSTDSQTGEYVLSFQLDGQGTRQFCRITREHTGERFAILLDDQVLTAPTINEPICGGSGQISGGFTAKSSNELAIMLRAGALPAPLNVIEQRSVGAELGQDAIKAGSSATSVAAVAVFFFMALFYGLFGVLACLALVVNMAMIVGAMSLGGATLTLPGIAGLVLTIGMAVDANVLIYERMREEKAQGRGPAMAIDAGFARAMVTIIDSHVTQFGAAIILFAFGEGPVKGFAWTLSIGCITSVITATFVTQILIALWFRAARPKDLPI